MGKIIGLVFKDEPKKTKKKEVEEKEEVEEK